VVRAKTKALGITYEQLESEILQAVSLRKKVTAQDVANTIAFLCSDHGSIIAGEAISVCGNQEYIR
jgi:enoyl-[acyl-carrier-protein] reductase (NADH)